MKEEIYIKKEIIRTIILSQRDLECLIVNQLKLDGNDNGFDFDFDAAGDVCVMVTSKKIQIENAE